MPLEAPVTNTIFFRRSMRHHNSNSRLAKTGRSAKDVALCRRRAYDASRAETAQALAKGQGAKIKNIVRFCTSPGSVLPDIMPSRLVRKIKHFRPMIIIAVLPRSASF
jgi:hypothetical protein